MSNAIKDAMKKAGIKGTPNPKNPTGKVRGMRNGISSMKKGKIKWFDIKKGIGFIVCDDGEEHFIYHQNIVLGREYIGFESGDEVMYRVSVDSKTGRLQAVNCSLDLDAEGKPRKPVTNNSSEPVEDSNDSDTEEASDTEATE